LQIEGFFTTLLVGRTWRKTVSIRVGNRFHDPKAGRRQRRAGRGEGTDLAVRQRGVRSYSAPAVPGSSRRTGRPLGHSATRPLGRPALPRCRRARVQPSAAAPALHPSAARYTLEAEGRGYDYGG